MKKYLLIVCLLFLYFPASSQTNTGNANSFVRDRGYFVVDSFGIFIPLIDSGKEFPNYNNYPFVYVRKQDSILMMNIGTADRQIVNLDPATGKIPLSLIPGEIGDGSVTSVAVNGNHAFSTSTANPTTNPVTTTILNTVNSHKFLGNNTSGRSALDTVLLTLADLPAGTGTITSINSGVGLLGGLITSSGTLSIDSAKVRTARQDDSINALNFKYADSSSILVTRTNASANYWKIGGNTIGGSLSGGSVDSNDVILLCDNSRVDSIPATTRAHYLQNAVGELSTSFSNKISWNGIAQANKVLIGIGSGGFVATNTPFIQFGSSLSSSNPMLSSTKFQFSSIQFQSTAGTNTAAVLYGALGVLNSGNAFSFAYGTYTAGAASAPTSGTLNLFALGVNSGTGGTFAPASGSAAAYALNDVRIINQTGSASGITGSLTNAGITLTSASDYRFCYATNNIGSAFYSGGTATNKFVGNTIVGSTTDDGANALQVTGSIKLETAGNKINIATGANSIINTAVLSSGTVTISNTSVTANSVIWIQYSTGSILSLGIGNVSTQFLVSSRVAATSFVITAVIGAGVTNITDNSTVQYWIIN